MCSLDLLLRFYFQTLSFKLWEHFNNLNSGEDFLGHDFKSLKAKRIRFKTRGTFPKLGFVSADKPLLMAFYYNKGV